MKKFVVIFLTLLYLIAYGSNLDDSIKQLKNIDNKIKKLKDQENYYMEKLDKIGNSHFIFRKQRKEGYLKKLNKIQMEKKNLNNEKNKILKDLKKLIQDELSQLYTEIFTKSIKDNSNLIFYMQKRYIYLKKIYDFYFGEKIDIIIHENEPGDIVRQKIKVLKVRIEELKKEIILNESLLKKLNEQIQFFKETKTIGNSEFASDYLEFLGQSKKYLKKDIKNKKSILQFYQGELNKMGGIK